MLEPVSNGNGQYTISATDLTKDVHIRFYIVAVTEDDTLLFSDEKHMVIGCPDLAEIKDTPQEH